MTLKQKILTNPHNVGEKVYIPNLVEQYSVMEIVAQIEEMLKGSTEDIVAALVFLRDALIEYRDAPAHNKLAKSIREKILKTKIIDSMNELLYSKNGIVRYQTIYTFGKTYMKDQAHLLHSAIDVYSQEYPDQLDTLLFEYDWLTHSVDKALLQDLVNQKNPQVTEAVKRFIDNSSNERTIVEGL